MLEERRKTKVEVAKKKEEEEALCAKAVEHVSHTWEAMIDDADLEKVAEQLRTIETEENSNEKWNEETILSRENG